MEPKDGNWVFNNAGTLADKNIEGHDVSPTVVDFDGDTVPDFWAARKMDASIS